MENKKVTIIDIARMAGVSTATVSRIINDVENCATEETRQKVLDIIKKYNYRPNLIAKSMVTNKTQSIGLIIPDITNQSFQDMIKGSEDIAERRGSSLVICSSRRKTNDYLKSVENMLQRNIDGYLLLGAPDEEAIVQLLNNQKVVVVDRVINEDQWPRVYIDHVKASYELVKYLISQGHRDIATITGPKSYILSQQRLEGYRKALEEAGIPFEEEKVFEADDFEVDSRCGAVAEDKASVGSLLPERPARGRTV